MTDATLPVCAETWPFEHLDPKARWGMRLSSLLLAVLVGIGVLFAGGVLASARDIHMAASLLWPGMPALIATCALVGWLYAGARWRHIRYALTPSGLRIQRGVFWRSDLLVPRSRVQHTDLHRGPLDRALGLAGLHVFTAGNDTGKVTLEGLPMARATALRDALIRGIQSDGV